MVFSLLNGLGAMGASISQFAGEYGLQAQRAELVKQQAILADQLATARERDVTQPFLKGQQAERLTSEEARSAANNQTSLTVADKNAASSKYSADASSASSRYTADVGMARTQAEINKPTETEKLFQFLGINPDGTPKGSSTAAPPAPASSTPPQSSEPIGDLGLVRYADGSVGTPRAGASDAETSAATPSSVTDNPIVRKALGLPALGSPEGARIAIANDVARDPEFKYKTAGQKAAEVEKRVGEATESGKQRFSFSAPVTLPDPDDPSKTISGVNRQNTKDGSIEFVRTDTNPNRPGEGGIGNRAEVVHQRVASAATMAAEAAKNIMELPAGSSTGWFGGREQGKSLLGAVKETLTNTVSSQDVQSYNVMLAGVARNLATIETSGLAPNAGFTKSMDSVVLKEGDTEITKMRRMAEIRQIVEFGLEPSLANPRLPEVQKAQLRSVIGKIKDAIPFTQHDITTLDKSSSNTSMNDVMKARGLGGARSQTERRPLSEILTPPTGQ